MYGHGGTGINKKTGNPFTIFQYTSVADKDNPPGYFSAEQVNNMMQFHGLDRLRQLADKKVFCSPCTIALVGCQVGKGSTGEALLQTIANLTKCTTAAYSKYVRPTIFSKKPSSGAWFYEAPDVIKQPVIK